MNSQQDRDKLLLEKLERLLASEGIKIDETPDEETRTALRFAQKMLALRQPPIPEFKAQLKARLLKELVEREEKARTQKSGWFQRFILRQVVWQAVTALTVLLVIGGVMWATGVFTPEAAQFVSEQASTRDTATLESEKGGAPPAAVTVPPTVMSAPSAKSVATLTASVSTDKETYSGGETVTITVVLKNGTSEPVRLQQYPPVVDLKDAESGQTVYSFSAGNSSLSLGAGETLQFILLWGQNSIRGTPVPSGSYFIELGEIQTQGQTLHTDFTTPVRFEIR